MPSCFSPFGGRRPGALGWRRSCALVTHTPDPPDDLPPSCQLPPELLTFILSHLLPSSYINTFAYQICRPPYLFGLTSTSSLIRGTTDLLNAISVCRSWRDVGTGILYEKPLLITNDHFLRFSRTVKSHPDLARLVKHPFVLFRAEDPSGPTPELSSSWRRVSIISTISRRSNNKNQEPEVVRTKAWETIISTLPLLTNVTSLTITIRNWRTFNEAVVPVHKHVVGVPTLVDLVGDRRHSLVIYGSALPHLRLAGCSKGRHSIPFETSFASLRVLCLREACFHSGFVFPAFVNLHTLQLAQCVHYPRSGSSPLTATSMPQLRSLHVFENTFRVSVGKNLMAQLEDLCYVNFTTDNYTPLPWATTSTPSSSFGRLVIPFMDVGGPTFREVLPKTIDRLVLMWTENKVSEPLETFGRLVATLRTVLGEKGREIRSVTVLKQKEETTVEVEGMMIGFENVKLEIRSVVLGEWIEGVLAQL